MTSISDTIVTHVTTYWDEDITPVPKIANFIKVAREKTLGESIIIEYLNNRWDPINENYADETSYLNIRIYTNKSDDRLLIFSNEIDRIFSTYGVSGFDTTQIVSSDDVSQRQQSSYMINKVLELRRFAVYRGSAVAGTPPDRDDLRDATFVTIVNESESLPNSIPITALTVDVIPNQTNLQSLGSDTKRFKDVYLQGLIEFKLPGYDTTQIYNAGGYLRIDPTGDLVIIYDGASNQNLGIYGKLGNSRLTLSYNSDEKRGTIQATNSGGDDADLVFQTMKNYVASDVLCLDHEKKAIFEGAVQVKGDLTVQGTMTTVESTTLAVKDNIIVVNDGETGAGVTLGSAGIEVERGSLQNAKIVYDESWDCFMFKFADDTLVPIWVKKLYVPDIDGSPVNDVVLLNQDETLKLLRWNETVYATLQAGSLKIQSVEVIDSSSRLINTLVKDIDATPVYDVLIKVVDGQLQIRNSADNVNASFSAGGLVIEGSVVIDSSKIADFISLKIGATEVISSSRVANFVSQKIGGTEVISSSRVADFVSLKIGGTEVINSSRNIFPGGGSYYISSSGLVANDKVLDSDKWDSYHFSDYLNQAVKSTSTPNFAKVGCGTSPTFVLHVVQSTQDVACAYFYANTYQGATIILDTMNNSASAETDICFQNEGVDKFSFLYCDDGYQKMYFNTGSWVLRFYFKNDGTGYADSSWTTFSAKIPEKASDALTDLLVENSRAMAPRNASGDLICDVCGVNFTRKGTCAHLDQFGEKFGHNADKTSRLSARVLIRVLQKLIEKGVLQLSDLT